MAKKKKGSQSGEDGFKFSPAENKALDKAWAKEGKRMGLVGKKKKKTGSSKGKRK